MMLFWKHKKFWLPLVLVLIIFSIAELYLRLGFYDRFVKPKSRMGQSFGRIADLKKLDINQVNWVTIGDSKLDWGFDHKRIRLSQLKKGVKHVRFSLAGSNFMSIHSSTEWVIENAPNLDGILLGLYEDELFQAGHPTKELKTAWPFRKYLKHNEFTYFRDFTELKTFKSWINSKVWYNSLAVTNFAADIKNLLTNPWRRLHELEKRENNWMNHIDHKSSNSDDMCEYNLKDLNQCIETASRFKNLKEVPAVFQSQYKNCSSETALIRQRQKKWKTNTKNTQPFNKQWSYLFNYILQHNKQLTLVMLPESDYYDYMSKPSNADELVALLKSQFESHPKFNLLDLRNLFDDNKCQYFFDALHFNNHGVEKLTEIIHQELIKQ